MKITKGVASRSFASGILPRGVETEVEPVHTAIADSQYFTATPWNLAEGLFRRRKLRAGPPGGQERRQQDRRQRQVRVLLDTRVAQSRRNQSIDENA